MEYNEEMEWWEVSRNIDGTEILFMVEDYKENEIMREVERLEKWMKDNLDEIVNLAIAEKLLEAKNHYWLVSGESEYSLEDVKVNLVLSEIGITSDKVELYYTENGMFDNNPVIIRLDNLQDDYEYFGVEV